LKFLDDAQKRKDLPPLWVPNFANETATTKTAIKPAGVKGAE